MNSIISDKNLAALGIEIPRCASNQSATILKTSPVNRSPLINCFKCRCGKYFLNLSSLVLNCYQHLDASERIKLQIDAKPQSCKNETSLQKIKKTIEVLETNKFKCAECSMEFTERYKYNDHIACHENPLLKCCEICKTKFTSGIRANRHKAKFHPELVQQTKELQLQSNQDSQKIKRKASGKCESSEGKFKTIHSHPNSILPFPETCTKFKSKKHCEKTDKLQNRKKCTDTQQQCPICLRVCLKANIKTHIIRHNRYSEQTVCFICNQDLKSNLKLKSHFRIVHKNNWYHFLRERTKSSISDEQSAELFYCEICYLPLNDEREKNVHRLVVHNKRHNQKPSSECRVCHKKFYSPVNRRIHEQRFHQNAIIPVNPNDFICDICGASYSHKGHLSLHMKRHATTSVAKYTEATKKRYGLCVTPDNMRDSSKHRYKMQFIKLDDDKVKIRFDCLACDENFASVEQIKSHLREFHPRTIRKFICEQCGVTFDEKNNLKLHLIKVHDQKVEERKIKEMSGESYSCKYCNKKFSSSEYDKYRHHARYHTQIKDDITCEICGSKLRTQQYLRAHMKRHQEKNIVCSYTGCDQKFTVPQNLKMHIKRFHLQAEVFKCRSCPNSYKSWNGRSYHEFKYHDGKKWRGQTKVEEAVQNFPLL